MVEFLTLFLGLITGPHPVAVSVGTEVARVELLLDGRARTVLTAPDWRAQMDFGKKLRPHVLEAVAYDRDGAVLDRTQQRINLPRAGAEAALVLQTDQQDRWATLSWENAQGEQPRRIRFLLDGEPLEVSDFRQIPLPAPDSRRTRLLQAELTFASGDIVSAELLFDGTGTEWVQTELTAVPLHWRRRLPSSTRRVALRRAGQSVSVDALERGPSLIVVVRGDSVAEALAGFATPFDEGSYNGTLTSSVGSLGVAGLDSGALAPPATATPEQQRRTALPFADDQTVRMVLPRAQRRSGQEVELELFATSPEIDSTMGGLLWLLGVGVHLEDLSPQSRLGDAVAVAGLTAARSNRRRGVLVVLGRPLEPDASRYSLLQARQYLEALGVPLEVWCLCATPGAGVVSIDDYRTLTRRFRDFQKGMEQQSIAWINGFALPSEFSAPPDASFSVLARAEDEP